MEETATVILVVGSTGAGKTTYSKRLAKDLCAALYSIDDWMKALFWQDMPENPDNAWFLENGKWYMERIHRCEDLILKSAIDRSKRKENSILDLGFSTAEHRIRFIQTIERQGIKAVIHYLDIPAEIRWQRVQQRNLEQGETFVMKVDRQMFDYVESIFEPPQESEGAKVTHINLSGCSKSF